MDEQKLKPQCSNHGIEGFKRRVDPISLATAETLPQTISFHTLQNVWFDKTASHELENKKKKLETRFWASSNDKKSRQPVEVCHGLWTQNTLNNLKCLDTSSEVEGETVNTVLPKIPEHSREQFEPLYSSLKQSEDLLNTMSASSRTLNRLWCNTVETLLNENYNLAKNVLYEELRESLKKDFLTGSVDPDKKACHIKYTERTKHLKRRFKLFQVSKITLLQQSELLYQNDLSSWKFSSVLIVMDPLGRDDFTSYWKAMDLQVVQDVFLSRCMLVKCDALQAFKTTWIREFNNFSKCFSTKNTNTSELLCERHLHLSQINKTQTTKEVQLQQEHLSVKSLEKPPFSSFSNIVIPHYFFLTPSNNSVSENQHDYEYQLHYISFMKTVTRLVEKSSFEAEMRSTIICNLLHIVNEWETTYADQKLLLPIVVENLWIDHNDHIYVHCGITLHLQKFSLPDVLCKSYSSKETKRTTLKTIPEHIHFIKCLPVKYQEEWNTNPEWKSVQKSIHAYLILNVAKYLHALSSTPTTYEDFEIKLFSYFNKKDSEFQLSSDVLLEETQFH